MPDNRNSRREDGLPARITIGPAELETFLVIAELGSFSKAAERLSLAQPSISNRVQRLEHAVRTRLFERTTRAVVLTPAGERLRARIEPVIRSLQSVIDEFRAEAETRSQSVVVATTPMLATVLLPPVINRFARSNPGIDVELRDQVTPELASQIRSGQVDFAVLSRRPEISGVNFEPVTFDRFKVVGPRDHPALQDGRITLQELSRHPFLVLGNYKARLGGLLAQAEAQGINLLTARTATNVWTLLGLIAEGLGLTLLPGVVLSLGGVIDDRRFGVAELDGKVLTREYGIASLADHQWSAGARAFAAAVRTELVAHSSNEPGPRPGSAGPGTVP